MLVFTKNLRGEKTIFLFIKEKMRKPFGHVTLFLSNTFAFYNISIVYIEPTTVQSIGLLVLSAIFPAYTWARNLEIRRLW